MSIKTHENRTLSFAGMLQALQLVQQTAYGRPYDIDAFQATLRSTLLLDADSVAEVYGGIDGVRSGLRLLQTQLLNSKQKPDVELSRYAVVLLHLERKLTARNDLMQRLRSGIDHAQNQVEHFNLMHANVLAGLANTYTETVSTLTPKIMVNGDPTKLQDSAIANQIRVLLLSAMRSAVLWRQCGGTKIGLIFGRRKLAETAKELLTPNVIH